MASRRYGRRAATGVLAVLFSPSFENQPLFNVPFFVPFFEGLEMEAAERDIELALCPLRHNELPRLVRERQVDGAVCLLTPYETTQQISTLHVPMVSIVNEVAEIPGLIIDGFAGTALTTRHLIELGHREIAFLGVTETTVPGLESNDPQESQRLRGYLQTLRSHGLEPNNLLVDTSLPEPAVRAGARGMERLLERCALAQGTRPDSRHLQLPFSALVCFNDSIAFGAIGVLRERGWQVPQDLSVVGFDDISLQHNFSPALTSVQFPRQQMARRAVQLLCDHQGDAHSQGDWRETFPVELVVRDSTRPFDAPSQLEN